jgi:hypothetical protein
MCDIIESKLGDCVMPTISMFFGIVIQMYINDHAPPHFHVRYAEHMAQININTLDIIKGNLPKRVMSLVQEWGQNHQNELMENWELCTRMKLPNNIEPLI